MTAAADRVIARDRRDRAWSEKSRQPNSRCEQPAWFQTAPSRSSPSRNTSCRIADPALRESGWGTCSAVASR